MQNAELMETSKPKTCGVKIYRYGDGCFNFSIRHIGDFVLNDYEELDLEVVSAKLVRRR